MVETLDRIYAVGIGHGRPARLKVRNPLDWIERHWVRGRFYEPEIVHFMCSLRSAVAGPAGFLDIGAHRGNHAVAALRVCGFDYVEAYEPLRANFDALREHMQINASPGQYRLTRAGVGLQSGPARFGIPAGHEQNSGMAREMPDGEPGELVGIWQVVAHAKEAPVPIVLVKCDVEGHEAELVPILLRAFDVPVISGKDLGEMPDGTRTALPRDHALYVP